MIAAETRPDMSSARSSGGSSGRIWGVARFELRRLQRSLLLLLGLLLLVSGLALYSGGLHQGHQATNARLITERERDFLAKQEKKITRRIADLQAGGKALSPDRKIYRNPAFIAQHGAAAIQTNGPLLQISVGLTPLQPQSTQVTLADPALLEAQENLQHPLQLWTGHFDLAFVLVYLLPLLLIVLSFDLTAGEQASGNLKMLLVQGGGLQALILGKLLARALVLAGMLALLTLLAWGSSAWMQQPFAWTRWNLMLLSTLCYGGIWLGLAAWLNALRWNPANIAAALASLWLLAVWVIPGAGQQLVQSLSPVPTRISYIQSYREASEQVRQTSSRLLGKYMEDHPELSGGADNHYAMLQLAKEQALAKAIRPVVETYNARLQRQQQLARWLQYLSPVSVFETSLMQLAGSGAERQQDYRAQVTTFHADWHSYFLPLIQRNQALGPEHLAQLPQFRYRELGLRALAGALIPQILFLGLLAAGLLGLSLQRYRHYEVIDAE